MAVAVGGDRLGRPMEVHGDLQDPNVVVSPLARRGTRVSFHGRGACEIHLLRGRPARASCDLQGVRFADDPFPVGQCTWYAEGRRPDVLGIVHGNAGTWLEKAKGRLPEGWFPVVGALAVWLPHHGGVSEPGHVAYVAAVSEEGRILLDDSNWRSTPTSPGLQVHEHWGSAASPSGYIYGGPAGAGPQT